MLNRLAWLSLLVTFVGLASAAQPLADVSESDVLALGARVHAGDRIAMRELLSLKTDGAVAEDVDVIMGGAIRNHPEAFLVEIARTQRAQCDSCLESLLGNLGDDFVDRFPEQIEDLSKRRTALRTVKVVSVQSLRDKCVFILDRQITQIRSLIKQGIAVKS